MFHQKLYKTLLWIQGVYTLLTALWALVDIDSFMVITGPKYDIWLVKTVSVLLLSICVVFFSGIFLKMHPLPLMLTGISTSAGLAAIDFYYTSIERIKWVYALDGITEILFLIAWLFLLANIKKLNI
jgi:hypothetical protein